MALIAKDRLADVGVVRVVVDGAVVGLAAVDQGSGIDPGGAIVGAVFEPAAVPIGAGVGGFTELKTERMLEVQVGGGVACG